MAIYLTADWHLGDTRMEILGRPFKSTDHQSRCLLRNFNQIITPEDTLIIVGDVCVAPAYLPEIAKFNGKKTLIRGNHDRPFTDEQLSHYFDSIIPEDESLWAQVCSPGIPGGSLRCCIQHYPTQGVPEEFNLVGHIHAAWKYQLNMMNVGIDANHFKPVDMDSIPNHLKAITEVYDEDVWVAYNKINTVYRDKRGKKSSYVREQEFLCQGTGSLISRTPKKMDNPVDQVLQEAYFTYEQGLPMRTSDVLAEWIDRHCKQGDFDSVKTLLNNLEGSRLPPAALTGVLSITSHAKEFLGETRKQFFTRTMEVLRTLYQLPEDRLTSIEERLR